MEKEKLTSPYDLVAEALNCKKATLTDESAMSKHPNWDSLSHVSIIVALELNYKIEIPDEDVFVYDNMMAIINLYNRLINS